MKTIFTIMVVFCCWQNTAGCGNHPQRENPRQYLIHSNIPDHQTTHGKEVSEEIIRDPTKVPLTSDKIVQQLKAQLSDLEKEITSNNDTFSTIKHIWQLVSAVDIQDSNGINQVMRLITKLSREAILLLHTHNYEVKNSAHGQTVMVVKSLLMSLHEAGLIRDRDLIG